MLFSSYGNKTRMMNDDEQTLTKASPFAFLVTPLSLPNEAELSSWGAAHLDNGPKLGQIAPDSLDALKPRWANGVKSNNSVGLISARGAIQYLTPDDHADLCGQAEQERFLCFGCVSRLLKCLFVSFVSIKDKPQSQIYLFPMLAQYIWTIITNVDRRQYS